MLFHINVTGEISRIWNPHRFFVTSSIRVESRVASKLKTLKTHICPGPNLPHLSFYTAWHVSRSYNRKYKLLYSFNNHKHARTVTITQDNWIKFRKLLLLFTFLFLQVFSVLLAVSSRVLSSIPDFTYLLTNM